MEVRVSFRFCVLFRLVHVGPILTTYMSAAIERISLSICLYKCRNVPVRSCKLAKIMTAKVTFTSQCTCSLHYREKLNINAYRPTYATHRLHRKSLTVSQYSTPTQFLHGIVLTKLSGCACIDCQDFTANVRLASTFKRLKIKIWIFGRGL